MWSEFSIKYILMYKHGVFAKIYHINTHVMNVQWRWFPNLRVENNPAPVEMPLKSINHFPSLKRLYFSIIFVPSSFLFFFLVLSFLFFSFPPNPSLISYPSHSLRLFFLNDKFESTSTFTPSTIIHHVYIRTVFTHVNSELFKTQFSPQKQGIVYYTGCVF